MTVKCEFIGIDVSKATLDVACHTSKEYKQFSNTTQGIKALIKWLESIHPRIDRPGSDRWAGIALCV